MKQELYLILPDIRSAHNVGAFFRTADACGVDAIFLVGYTPIPPRSDIAKVALGADTWMKWKQYKNLNTLLKNLKKKGVHIVALEKTSTSEDIGNAKFSFPLALVVGNEVEGVSESTLKLCESVVHIPMRGKKGSLNVSVAGGIALYVTSQKRESLLY